MNDKRRKILEKIQEDIINIMPILKKIAEDERLSFDNLTKGLQYSERGIMLEYNADNLDDCYYELENMINTINDVIE